MKTVLSVAGAMGLMMLASAPVVASVASSSITGELLGTDLLSQFNPALGTLDGVSFQLSSVASGQATVTGLFVPGIDGPDSCAASSASVNVTLVGAGGDLSTALVVPVTATLTPPGCSAMGSFSQTVNEGPVAGLGSLASYSGTSLIPFTFTVSGASTADWTGTLTVNYTYNSDTGGLNLTPEPSAWMLAGAGMGLIGLARKRRR